MDWRSSLTPQSRADVIQKLIEVVKLAAPSQDQSKLAELAASTEQAIFEKSKNRQEYILLLQQKISNLQAKIAVIQKTQSSLPNYNYQSSQSPVIAPKYPTAQMNQMNQMGGNVPVNLRNMVLNLQQQQAQNIQNSLKNQQAAQQALQAAKIAQKTLIGVQLASNKVVSSPLSSPAVTNVQTPMQAPSLVGSSAIQTSSSSPSSSINFPSLNLSDAQKSSVTEKLKKIMPIYQKMDLVVNYLSAAETPSKTNIQKLLQVKNLLTEQYKNIKKRIFLSPDGLDNIYEFLVKMLQAAEEVRRSKISTPIQSAVQTPTNVPKTESISNAFKYAMEQEIALKKSGQNIPEIYNIISEYDWTSELRMYGTERRFSPIKSLDTVYEDYEYLFGSVIDQGKTLETAEMTIETEISQLEKNGFNITRLQDYQESKVFLVKHSLAGWSIILHVKDNLIREWQLLEAPTITIGHEIPLKSSLSLDRTFLEGKSVEMIQFLQFY